MVSVLVSKIISTESFSVNQIFENKGKAYTYLNPVSYLTALDIRSYSRSWMVSLRMVGCW